MPCYVITVMANVSLPIRGAWIEISTVGGSPRQLNRSLPIRGAWIEIDDMTQKILNA